jgi:plastocyanin
MRSAFFLAFLCACNGLTGVEKYVLDGDDGGAAPEDASPAGSNDGATGSESGASCPATSTPVVPKCTEQELAAQIHTDPGDARLIRAPSDEKEAPYQPNCMTIKLGQTVTWTGDLTDHPVIPREDSTQPNPINPNGAGVTSWPITFPCPGDFNFSCRNHRDLMLGTIRVIP